MVMVAQTPAFVVPQDWYEVLEARQARSAEYLIARTFGNREAHHTCVGPVTSEDGEIWNCEWCGGVFTQAYHGAHARHIPHYLADLSTSLNLVDELRRRDPTLEVEIQLYPKEGCSQNVLQTRIHAERMVAEGKQAELNRFVSGNEYATLKRSPLCVALFEALFELYEFSLYQESETR